MVRVTACVCRAITGFVMHEERARVPTLHIHMVCCGIDAYSSIVGQEYTKVNPPALNDIKGTPIVSCQSQA